MLRLTIAEGFRKLWLANSARAGEPAPTKSLTDGEPLFSEAANPAGGSITPAPLAVPSKTKEKHAAPADRAQARRGRMKTAGDEVVPKTKISTNGIKCTCARVCVRVRVREGGAVERSVKDLFITREELEKIATYRLANQQTAKYYKDLAEDPFVTPAERDRYSQKSFNIGNCNTYWIFNAYPRIGIKDKIGAISCKDKFCPICQKAIQASRETRFTPMLNKIADDYDIYHLTLTIPNVVVTGKMKQSEFDQIHNKMISGFKLLIRHLSGNAKKNSGLGFEGYGYAGALRNLEFKISGNECHSHIHCLLAFKKGAVFEKYILNRYSYKRDGTINYFSDFEILIQKVWRLIITGVPVKKENIDALPLGYSCYMCKKEKGEYAEIFKYVTKSEKGAGFHIPFNVFARLESWLSGRRAFQGYGVFYNLQAPCPHCGRLNGLNDKKCKGCDLDILIDTTFSNTYNRLVAYLKVKDIPCKVHEELGEIMINMSTGRYLYITRAKIAVLLRKLYTDDELAAAGDLNFVNDHIPKARFELVRYEPEPELSEEQLLIADLIRPLV